MRIKGVAILSRQAFVEKHFGKDAWARVLNALSPASQQLFAQTILAGHWYPFLLGIELDTQIVETLSFGDTRLFEALGRTSADENLRGMHKSYLTPGDPARFMAKAPSIYRQYYDSGQRTYTPTSPTSGILVTEGAAASSRIDCLTVIGWYKQALELCGASRVRISEDECCARGGRVCRYRVAWG